MPPICAHQATWSDWWTSTMTNWVTTQNPSTQAAEILQRDEAERQHPNQHARMQHQIGGDDAGNRAAGADQRQLGARQQPGVGQAAGDPAQQIEHQELEVAHGVLDVVAEHPQEQHVGAEVEDIAMQEHVGEQRVALRHGQPVQWHRAPARRRPAPETARLGTSAKLAAIDAPLPGDLPAGNERVGGDEADRNPLKADRAQGVVVGERNEDHGLLPLPVRLEQDRF